jgi:hypothetical protein
MIASAMISTARMVRRPIQFIPRHHVREFNPDRKDHHWGKRKLARDR